MNRWIGKLAVVTGASSGIGARIAIDLVNAGMIVVGLARRVERVEELKANISTTTTGELHALRCDVTKEEDVLAAFEWIETKFGGVDVLVNNAGVLRSTRLTTKDNTTAIRDVIDTNIFAVVMCTREAFQSMRRRNFDGHIFLMNSIGGHSVAFLDSFNIYQPSKYAVTAMTEVLRQEFQTEGTRIKVTSISPGLVRTEMFSEEMLNSFKDKMLVPEDVSNALLYALGTPSHVQVHEIIIKVLGEQI